MKKEHDIQMVIVDYLQLMSVDLPKKSKTNRNDEVKIIVKGLKTIAEELQIPVVATSQLSRIVETRDDFRPCLDDLSNEISKLDFVDDVRLLYRPSYYGLYKKNDYDDIMEVIASERNYGLGTIELSFERNKQPLYQEVNFIPIVK